MVVNGTSADADLCEWLRLQADVQLECTDVASAPGAVRKGRSVVRTEYFSTLDDDDEYLPLCTDRKLMALGSSLTSDFLVTNAYVNSGGIDELLYDNLAEVAGFPLKSLVGRTWLTSGNALFRSAGVGVAYFEEFHPYMEWTWLAFKLAMDGKRLTTICEPTCRYHSTPESLSKSEAFLLASIPLLKRMLDRDPPAEIAALIKRRLGAEYHDVSDMARQAKHMTAAWRYHAHSLFRPGGWRYLPYTRRLFK